MSRIVLRPSGSFRNTGPGEWCPSVAPSRRDPPQLTRLRSTAAREPAFDSLGLTSYDQTCRAGTSARRGRMGSALGRSGRPGFSGGPLLH
jgi:hypothetical protein